MSSDGPGVRFWRKQKLGSRDFTLRESRETGDGDGEGDGSIRQGTSTEYRTYKRRWFGLAQLTLMNIIVSWDVRLKFQPLTESRYMHADSIHSG
jgi:FLVCR family MFS transporter 7